MDVLKATCDHHQSGLSVTTPPVYVVRGQEATPRAPLVSDSSEVDFSCTLIPLAASICRSKRLHATELSLHSLFARARRFTGRKPSPHPNERPRRYIGLPILNQRPMFEPPLVWIENYNNSGSTRGRNIPTTEPPEEENPLLLRNGNLRPVLRP